MNGIFESCIIHLRSFQYSFWAIYSVCEQSIDLHFSNLQGESETANLFFSEILPKIIQLALGLPDILPCAIPLLKRGQNKSISLTQQQAACLLANAFLCTFPGRNDLERIDSSTFPNINFSSLFCSPGLETVEKIRCICSYFRRVCKNSKYNSMENFPFMENGRAFFR